MCWFRMPTWGMTQRTFRRWLSQSPKVRQRWSMVLDFLAHTSICFLAPCGQLAPNFLVNILFNTTLSDMETCYKLIPTNYFPSNQYSSQCLDIEPEITCRLLKRGIKIYEVPISYVGRDHSQGKKITWMDGFSSRVMLRNEYYRMYLWSRKHLAFVTAFLRHWLTFNSFPLLGEPLVLAITIHWWFAHVPRNWLHQGVLPTVESEILLVCPDSRCKIQSVLYPSTIFFVAFRDCVKYHNYCSPGSSWNCAWLLSRRWIKNNWLQLVPAVYWSLERVAVVFTTVLRSNQ